jgi:hypothetical protein
MKAYQVIGVGLMVAALCIAKFAFADDDGFPPTIVHVQASQLPTFSTLVEAGVHGVARAYQCSRYYECGGIIATDRVGKFVVFPVASDYASDHVSIDDDNLPDGYIVVATYHTHPCIARYVTQMFSPNDLMNAILGEAVAFMGDLCTGKVHEFDPNADKPNTEQVGPTLWLTQGRIVGQITLTEPIKIIAEEGI